MLIDRPPDPWPAPVAEGPVRATVSVPGSKSLANRALVLAAGAVAPTTVTGLPAGSRDLDLMAAALSGLGNTMKPSAVPGVVTVTPGTVAGAVSIDCGLAGTVMRFVPPAAGLTRAEVRFDGDPRARERPMGPVLAGLRHLGLQISDGATGTLPFTVQGSGHVAGGDVEVDASASSQFVTALLLSGARFDRGVTVRHRGGPVPSLPHIGMTVRMLAEHGVVVEADVVDRRDAVWRVEPGPIAARDRVIEPDLSNATPFVALAVATAGQVLIRDWPQDSLQPAGPLMEVFGQLGADFRATPDGMVVTGGGRVQGIHADLRDLGELVPTIAALCALADGPSRLTGIGHIAGHETDRLQALATQLSDAGGTVSADHDGLTITPTPLHGGLWRTYHDHRMATCGAILGAVVPGVLIENVATTAKTFPTFPALWSGAVLSGRGG